jgi:hypothetical protein
MKLRELLEFLNQIPAELADFDVEIAELVESDESGVKYRLDKPVVAVYVREDTKEVLLMNAPIEQYENEIDNEQKQTYEHNPKM